MAQPIRPAEIQMNLVAGAEGMPGMLHTSAPPGSQMMLDPSVTPQMSNQPQRQAQFVGQQMTQRGIEAQMQGLAGATRLASEQVREAGEAQAMAKELKNKTVDQILEVSSAPVMGLINSDKGFKEALYRDTLQGMAVAQRTAPDLADYAGQLAG